MIQHPTFFGLIALIMTGIVAALAWQLIGAPALVGIDDAAITRTYAENIAGGYGFVYNAGGERVEGATSFLWTVLVALIYLLPFDPNIAILFACFAITVAATGLHLAIAARLAHLTGISATTSVAATAALLIGVPDFFVWSVFSMMELALWSTALALLLFRLIVLSDPSERSIGPVDPWLLIAAIALPLIRPEGVAMATGLIVLSMVLVRRAAKPLAVSLVASLVSFAGLVVFRLVYFGFPMPNTYYAKVSSDRLQNVEDGTKFLASFLQARPFAEVAVLFCVLGLMLAVLRLRQNWAPAVVLIGCTVLGVLGTYVVLGGDHFALWRLYQPVVPLMIVFLAITVQVIGQNVSKMLPNKLFVPLSLVGVVFYLALNWLFLFQSRADVVKEYDLTAKGIEFGTFLNSVSPRPHLGVIAAGGIALGYDGKISDLMGLNWVKMAHANTVKEGFRNHASFDKETFYQFPPEMIAMFTRDQCQTTGWIEPRATSGPLKGLLTEQRFQDMFQPIIMTSDNGECWNGFAQTTWLGGIDDPRIQQLSWASLTLM